MDKSSEQILKDMLPPPKWPFSELPIDDKTTLLEDKVSPKSKATTVNPKDLFGSKKVSITKLPSVAILHGAHAMMDGAKKYGPYNWRDKEVIASIYIDAAIRHIQAWFEGEETAQDSGVHHLGHAIACCAILLDAQEMKKLVDDRPNGQSVASRVQARLAEVIKERNK